MFPEPWGGVGGGYSLIFIAQVQLPGMCRCLEADLIVSYRAKVLRYFCFGIDNYPFETSKNRLNTDFDPTSIGGIK